MASRGTEPVTGPSRAELCSHLKAPEEIHSKSAELVASLWWVSYAVDSSAIPYSP